MTACSIDGCDKPVRARGWCMAHWNRWRRNGHPLAGHPSPRASFWDWVDAEGDCWLWTGALTDNGYGRHGKKARAHRVAWEILVGPIPGGLVIDHLCRNRACVNPDHLEPITRAENLYRGYGWSGRNVRKTRCVNGHAYTPANTRYRNDGKGRECRACGRDRYREAANG